MKVRVCAPRMTKNVGYASMAAELGDHERKREFLGGWEQLGCWWPKHVSCLFCSSYFASLWCIWSIYNRWHMGDRLTANPCIHAGKGDKGVMYTVSRLYERYRVRLVCTLFSPHPLSLSPSHQREKKSRTRERMAELPGLANYPHVRGIFIMRLKRVLQTWSHL